MSQCEVSQQERYNFFEYGANFVILVILEVCWIPLM